MSFATLVLAAALGYVLAKAFVLVLGLTLIAIGKSLMAKSEVPHGQKKRH